MEHFGIEARSCGFAQDLRMESEVKRGGGEEEEEEKSLPRSVSQWSYGEYSSCSRHHRLKTLELHTPLGYCSYGIVLTLDGRSWPLASVFHRNNPQPW